MRLLLASLLSCALVLPGCTTPNGEPNTVMNRTVAKCALAIGIGALAGAFIGSKSGSGNTAAGAGLGAVAGGTACAVIVKLDKDDRERIAVLEKQAVQQNKPQTQVFTAKNGSEVKVATTIKEAPVPTATSENQPKYTDCRYSNKTITVASESTKVEPQLWCRLETGDWTAV